MTEDGFTDMYNSLRTGDAAGAPTVATALATLPFEDATALLFHYDVGLSASEVAELADVGEEAMKSRLRRARQRFMTAYRREQGG